MREKNGSQELEQLFSSKLEKLKTEYGDLMLFYRGFT
jgi:predicted aldo/keto reductase-like oxidoreductase